VGIDSILWEEGEASGLVPGSLVLLGGDPGIGKSTLALQAAVNFSNQNIKTLYVSGEESLPQIRLRAERLGHDLSRLLLLAENNLEAIIATLNDVKPEFVVIDSIQTMFSEEVGGVAGGVAQVANATNRIMEFIKSRNLATMIIGHVTKEGNLAGPKMLEHMVDVVMYMEGDRFSAFRLLRCVKNRFGSTNEVGVFEMQTKGLQAVANPSQLFLAERARLRPGSAVTCTIEGSRPLLLEIQALTSRSQFNYPKRNSTGYDMNRLLMLTAVLQKHLRLNLFDQDLFVSVAGGFRVEETACDLGVALAILSSLRDVPVPEDLAAIGEVGLSGEIRMVPQAEKRAAEAGRLGFKRILLPAARSVSNSKIKLIPVSDLREVLAFLKT